MTERLADISARIEGVQQLGAVVNAMKGIAAARAHVARTQVGAVDSYAQTIAKAMAQAITTETGSSKSLVPIRGKTALLVFCAEQGFAGAYSERVLASIGDDLDPDALFLIGTRGLSVAAARDITPIWTAALPSHSDGIPKLAESITMAIYQMVDDGSIDNLDVLFTAWDSGRPSILRQKLFPLDLTDLPYASSEAPIMQLPFAKLMDTLGRDYFHAQICKAALHAFAAENEARMEAMTAAGTQIAHELKTFQATLRRVRQEAITAEIVELGTGVAAKG